MLLLLLFFIVINAQILKKVSDCRGSCHLCNISEPTKCVGNSTLITPCDQGYNFNRTSGVCVLRLPFNSNFSILQFSQQRPNSIQQRPTINWRNSKVQQCSYKNSKGVARYLDVIGLFKSMKSISKQFEVSEHHEIYLFTFNLVRNIWMPNSDFMIVDVESGGQKISSYEISYDTRQGFQGKNVISCQNQTLITQKFNFKINTKSFRNNKVKLTFTGFLFNSLWGITNIKFLPGCQKFSIYNKLTGGCDFCDMGYFPVNERMSLISKNQLLRCQKCAFECNNCMNETFCYSCIKGYKLVSFKCVPDDQFTKIPISETINSEMRMCKTMNFSFFINSGTASIETTRISHPFERSYGNSFIVFEFIYNTKFRANGGKVEIRSNNLKVSQISERNLTNRGFESCSGQSLERFSIQKFSFFLVNVSESANFSFNLVGDCQQCRFGFTKLTFIYTEEKSVVQNKTVEAVKVIAKQQVEQVASNTTTNQASQQQITTTNTNTVQTNSSTTSTEIKVEPTKTEQKIIKEEIISTVEKQVAIQNSIEKVQQNITVQKPTQQLILFGNSTSQQTTTKNSTLDTVLQKIESKSIQQTNTKTQTAQNKTISIQPLTTQTTSQTTQQTTTDKELPSQEKQTLQEKVQNKDIQNTTNTHQTTKPQSEIANPTQSIQSQTQIIEQPPKLNQKTQITHIVDQKKQTTPAPVQQEKNLRVQEKTINQQQNQQIQTIATQQKTQQHPQNQSIAQNTKTQVQQTEEISQGKSTSDQNISQTNQSQQKPMKIQTQQNQLKSEPVEAKQTLQKQNTYENTNIESQNLQPMDLLAFSRNGNNGLLVKLNKTILPQDFANNKIVMQILSSDITQKSSNQQSQLLYKSISHQPQNALPVINSATNPQQQTVFAFYTDKTYLSDKAVLYMIKDNQKVYLSKFLIQRTDFLNNKTQGVLEGFRELFHAFSWLIIAVLIIAILTAKIYLIQETFQSMQFILFSIYIFTSYLPGSIANTISGLRRLQNLDFLPEDFVISLQKWLLGDLIQQSPLRLIIFHKDVNFIRGMIPLIFLLLLIGVWFLLVVIYDRKTRKQGDQHDQDGIYGDNYVQNSGFGVSNLIRWFHLEVVRKIARNKLDYWTQILQMVSVSIFFLAFKQFNNFSYPENYNGQVFNIIFCLIIFVSTLVLLFGSVVISQKQYYKLQYGNFLKSYTAIYHKKIPKNCLPTYHHLLYNPILKLSKSILFCLLVAIVGGHPIPIFVVMLIMNAIQVIYAWTHDVYQDTLYFKFLIVESAIFSLMLLILLILSCISSVISTDGYLAFGYVFMAFAIVSILNGIGRSGYLIADYSQKQIQAKQKPIQSSRIV